MEVKLIEFTEPNNLKNVLPAICYGKETTSTGFNTAINSGHYSLLEHFYITFKLSGLSRCCSLQLINHRFISKIQQSQRYTQIDDNMDWYVIPESIWNHNGFIKKYCIMHIQLIELYKEMINEGIPKEDARYILPESCYTTLIVSTNLRAFVEICQKRLCNKAQWEIRNLFSVMKQHLMRIYPFIENLATPNCERTGCIEKIPCKKPN